MRAIVRGGANVNAQCADGLTLLDWAIRRDNTTAFDFLLGAGASPTIFDKYGDNVIR
ncbi:MAG TPA: ankyrin repeat domain-containing protein [Gemmatimonadaceae bacterium]|jgi:ankyrin repeat protein